MTTSRTPALEHYLSAASLLAQVRAALAEDVGAGDLTAELIPASSELTAEVVCREPATVCGRPWFDAVFHELSSSIAIDWQVVDGDTVAADTRLCRLRGPARALLTGERTALNFLQSLSGTATETARWARALAGTGSQVLDTRKTVPGLRAAQKYAVACGGGGNHRIGLFDAILIKENHIAAAGSIAAALAAVQRSASAEKATFVEVEVETLEELEEALNAGATRLLLDNFTEAMLAEAVARNAGRARLEVSGNVSLERVREIAALGVDYISAGALTKHIRAVDLSMRFTGG